MKKRERIELNITPIIDVVFILFTFFLVATSFKKEKSALNINLPSTKAYSHHKSDTKSTKIELGLKSIAIEKKIIELETFRVFVKKIDKTNNIELKIDKNVNYERISEVLDILKSNELNKISLITKTKKD